MRKNIVVVLLSCITFSGVAQNIAGNWTGTLKVQSTQLKLIFHINKTESGYTATMDSPDQGAFGLPASKVTFAEPTVIIEAANLGINYTGELKGDLITGIFQQGAQKFNVDLSRSEDTVQEKIKRPQEPSEPYPYYTEEVTFKNAKEDINLSGTLSLPKKEGIFPVVVLISGSGPQNRDEEMLGHKPFLVLSDYLVKNGIGVLRYDDRGVGKSGGVFKTATSADFAVDAASAVEYLKTRKEINKAKIGLIGHSEGGLIAPIVATETKGVSFIVLLAGPGLEGDQVLLAQQELIARAGGKSDSEIQKNRILNEQAFDLVKKYTDPEALKTQLTAYITETSKNDPDKPENVSLQDYVNAQVSKVSSPWMVSFLRYNPGPVLQKVKCPVLALNGEKDLQVAPKENLEAIKKSLAKGGNKKVTIKELPNLNHLFQESTTGLPTEYGKIEQTISPVALQEITKWLTLQLK